MGKTLSGSSARCNGGAGEDGRTTRMLAAILLIRGKPDARLPRKPGKVPEVVGCLESEQSRFAASVEIAKEQPVTTLPKATKAGLAATSPDTYARCAG
jgi:hypothetical protein